MKRKNILMLMCDQLNANVLTDCIRSGSAPNIAKLAQNSADFQQAYCQTPLCTPSRASVITGRYPHRHGMVSNVMRRDYPVCGGPETEEGIRNEDCTTEKVLWQQGYRVRHFGKWHLSGDDLDYYPDMYREHYEYAAEMEETFSRVEKNEYHMDWYGWKLPVNPTEAFRGAADKIREPWRSTPRLHDFYAKIGPTTLGEEDTYDYRTASLSASFLLEDSPEPFMLTCSFNAPHDPNVVPLSYYKEAEKRDYTPDPTAFCEALFRGDLSFQVAQQGGEEFMREFLHVYYASVLFLDAQVGRVLKALEKSGKEEDTIVVFLADHGDMAGEHGMFWKSTKAFYDGVSRVPLMISCPDILPPGKYEFPVELVDVMPTLLELCGCDTPESVQGKSLTGFCTDLAGAGGLAAFSERLEWNEEHTRRPRVYDEFSFMLRDSRYKYSLFQEKDKRTEYLYDMLADPGELTDLSGSEAQVLGRMRKKLMERLDKTGCECDFKE